MSTVFVEFTDETQTVVGSVFASPQNNADHPHYSVIDSEDERYKTFLSLLAASLN